MPLARDAAAFCALALGSLVIGLLFNLTRPHPLPLRYVSRENRLEFAVRRVDESALPVLPAAAPREIDLEEFQRFATTHGGSVLDARAETFYHLGHVPGALNLSREAFERDYAALRPALVARKNQPMAVYCSGADCPDAGLVAEALRKLGYRNLLIYPEGWEQWSQAGLPQEPAVKD